MTQDTIDKIEDCAVLQFTRDQIATIVDDPEVTAALTGGKASATVKAGAIKAMMRGWLRGEADCRRAIKAEADSGSTSAQKLLMELVWARKNSEGEE